MSKPTQNFLRLLVPGENPNLDIVAVHGLNPTNGVNHAEETWTSEEKLWLKDFLPSQLPQARIFLFGYNSNVAFQSSSAGVREQADNLLNRLWLQRLNCPDRPILFFAHSLGGIIVKKALVESKLVEKYSSLGNSTYGIAFFGTPHQGGNYARLGGVVANIVRAVSRGQQNSFMESLKKDSLYSDEIVQNFRHQLEDYYVLSFYETEPFKKIGVIVDKKSATLGLSGNRETQVALGTDHSGLCRFASAEDENYEQVVGNIVHMAQNAIKSWNERQRLAALESLPEKEDQRQGEAVFMLPYRRNLDFVSREDKIHDLKARLTPFGKGHRRVALHGIGGIGKTQIAIEFSNQVHDEYPDVSIFWIHGSTVERFIQSYLAIADKLKIPNLKGPEKRKVARVGEWLGQESQRPWLMIIDNIDNIDNDTSTPSTDSCHEMNSAGDEAPSMTLRDALECIPACSHGAVLVTTQNKAFATSYLDGRQSDIIEVGKMSAEASRALVERKLANLLPLPPTIEELMGQLEFHPLALTQASSFIQENSISIQEYVELYNSNTEIQMALLNEPIKSITADSNTGGAPVMSTLILSIAHIEKRCALAAEILSIMALCDRHSIPIELLQGAAGEDTSTEKLSSLKALGVLKAYGLIIETYDHAFDIHKLVQLSVHQWLKGTGKFHSWLDAALTRICSLLTNLGIDKVEPWKRLVPHATSAVNQSLQLGSSLPFTSMEARDGIRVYLTWYFTVKVEDDQGIALWPGAPLRTDPRQPQHSNMDATQELYMYHTMFQENWAEAESFQRVILEDQRRMFGLHHLKVLKGTIKLAEIYLHQKKAEDATPLIDFIVGFEMPPYDQRHRALVMDILTLIDRCLAQSRYEETHRLQKKLLEMLQDDIPPSDDGDGDDDDDDDDDEKHPTNIQKTARKAEELQRKLLLSFQKPSPGEPRLLSLLVTSYDRESKWQEAERYHRQFMDLNRKWLLPDHSLLRIDRIYLADIHARLGRWDEAEALLIDVLTRDKDKEKETSPRSKWYVVLGRQKLADIYRHQGRLRDAEQMAGEALDLGRKSLGPTNQGTLLSMDCLAKVYEKLGEYKKAVGLQRERVEALSSCLGPDDHATILARCELAVLSRRIGECDNAEELIRNALADSCRILGVDHSKTVALRSCLSLLYLQLYRFGEHRILAEEILSQTTNRLGPQNLKTAECTLWVAGANTLCADYQRAEQLATQCLQTRRRDLGADHPLTWNCQEELAIIKAKQGQLDEAETMHTDVLHWRKDHLGESHLDTLRSMRRILSIQADQGRFKLARQLGEKALDICETSWGPDHPSALEIMQRLARILQNEGRFRRAQKMFLHVLQAQKERLSPSHDDTLHTAFGLSLCYLEDHQPQLALGPALEVFESRRRIPNYLENLHYWGAALQLSNVYYFIGKRKDALDLLAELVEAGNGLTARGEWLTRGFGRDLSADLQEKIKEIKSFSYFFRPLTPLYRATDYVYYSLKRI